MLFNSYIFIFLFFPLCLAGYFGLNHFKHYQLAQLFLLGMSLWFYGYFNPMYLIIILISIIVNYICSTLLIHLRSETRRKLILFLGIVFNIGILFYYKYYDFFITNINQVFQTEFTLQRVILPLGISFFTFQQVSYVVDAYRGEVPHYDFVKYASFVTYFPQLIAGPIVLHDELVPQFEDLQRKRFDWSQFAPGIYMFAQGLAKKVLIADMFGGVANWGFKDVYHLDSTNALIVMFAYTIQIYFDFSGYCDMAIGIGKMMNIDLPDNFNSPYKAFTITEFWQRWHMTLTRFLTKYIYIPLGGNRRGVHRTYVNIMIVFFVSGLWHGANWTFIVWGLLHGLYSVVTRKWQPQFDRMHDALKWLLTFTFLNLTWIFFRANSMGDAISVIKTLFRFDYGPINAAIVTALKPVEVQFVLERLLKLQVLVNNPNVLVGIVCLALLVIVLGCTNTYTKMTHFKPTFGKLIVTVVLLVWCILSFAGISTFLYFNF